MWSIATVLAFGGLPCSPCYAPSVRKAGLFVVGVLGLVSAVLVSGEVSANPSSTPSGITMYSASWCGACNSLQRSLEERSIPFYAVDVDKNPGALARAGDQAGTRSIPLTNVKRSGDERWIIGADPDAVERAYRGE
jgi:glutaredoxin